MVVLGSVDGRVVRTGGLVRGEGVCRYPRMVNGDVVVAVVGGDEPAAAAVPVLGPGRTW